MSHNNIQTQEQNQKQKKPKTSRVQSSSSSSLPRRRSSLSSSSLSSSESAERKRRTAVLGQPPLELLRRAGVLAHLGRADELGQRVGLVVAVKEGGVGVEGRTTWVANGMA